MIFIKSVFSESYRKQAEFGTQIDRKNVKKSHKKSRKKHRKNNGKSMQKSNRNSDDTQNWGKTLRWIFSDATFSATSRFLADFWVPAGSQNRPRGAPVTLQKFRKFPRLSPESPGSLLRSPEDLPECPRDPPGMVCGPPGTNLWTLFDWFWTPIFVNIFPIDAPVVT